MKKITLTLCALSVALTISAANNNNQSLKDKASSVSSQSQTTSKTTSSSTNQTTSLKDKATSTSSSKTSSSNSSYLKYDFEDGKTTNWTSNSSQNVKVSKSNSYQGSYALSICNDGLIEQEVRLPAGTYTISAYARLVSGSRDNAMMVVYEKMLKSNTYSVLATELIKSTKKYNQVKTTIKLHSDTTIKLVFSAGRNTDVLVDDIDITRKK